MVLVLFSCGGDDEEGEISATLSSLQENIFSPTCATAGCHSSGARSGSLVLEEGSSFGNLVNIDSTESDLKRVLPGGPDNSYLIHKLNGTQSSVGGSGSQMPLGSSPLSEEAIQKIREWIAAGAEDN